MIWAILAALGIPLWFCAIGVRGHAIWISDVFAWRGSPAAWNEELLWVSDATARTADPEERKKLHRLGDEPTIATCAAASTGRTVSR